MAHFAKIDNTGLVTQVIVVHNDQLLDENGVEQEAKGIQFCKSILGGDWVQTSYHSSFRKNYASKGFVYDKVRDAFIPPKQYESWVLDEDTCRWEPPTQYPDDGGEYFWDESTLSWTLVG